MYENGVTIYYNGSDPCYYTLEATIRNNNEKNQETLQLLLELNVPRRNSSYNLTNFRFAYEAAQNANSIYPGTVRGIILNMNTKNFDASDAKDLGMLLDVLNSTEDFVRNKPKIPVGTLQACNFEKDGQVLELGKQILRKTDILICQLSAADRYNELGASHAFTVISEALVQYKSQAKRINPSIEFFALSDWVYMGSNYWENPVNFEVFWREANDWASKNKINFLMDEAIDNPRSSNDHKKSPHLGWWKLQDKNLINSVQGYVEKISGELTNFIGRTIQA